MRQEHPYLFVFVLKSLGMIEQARAYMEECDMFYDDDVTEYSKYIFGYLLPWFDE